MGLGCQRNKSNASGQTSPVNFPIHGEEEYGEDKIKLLTKAQRDELGQPVTPIKTRPKGLLLARRGKSNHHSNEKMGETAMCTVKAQRNERVSQLLKSKRDRRGCNSRGAENATTTATKG